MALAQELPVRISALNTVAAVRSLRRILARVVGVVGRMFVVLRSVSHPVAAGG